MHGKILAWSCGHLPHQRQSPSFSTTHQNEEMMSLQYCIVRQYWYSVAAYLQRYFWKNHMSRQMQVFIIQAEASDFLITICFHDCRDHAGAPPVILACAFCTGKLRYFQMLTSKLQQYKLKFKIHSGELLVLITQ